MDLDRLEELLVEISRDLGAIDHIDLYGGEISALPVDYQLGLLDTIRRHFSGTINLNTNYIRISPIVNDPNVITSVSFDGPARERWETTLTNIAVSPVPVAILILCTPKVIEFGVEAMIEMLGCFSNILSVEIKPYSSNQSNNLGVSDVDFERYTRTWIENSHRVSFPIENTRRLDRSLSGEYEAYSTHHAYITPSGKIGVLEFDLNDREFFLELDSTEDFKQWTAIERNRVVNNSYCGQCKYLGRCLTEHYRHVDNVEQSCNGFYHLLEWYAESSAK